MTDAKPLSPKEIHFGDLYVVEKNATKAAEKAGFSKKTAAQIGYQLLHKPSVAKYIREKMQTVAEKLGITHEYVLGGIKNVADETAKRGMTYDPKATLKAHELLGKHLRLFDEEQKTQQTININVIQF